MIDDSLVKRFWSKVNKKTENECWEWIGTVRNKRSGYGHIRLTKQRKTVYASRLSLSIYEKLNDIPNSNILCCHKCDNPICVNPNHLFWGSHLNNVQDMIKKNRRVISCSKGENNGFSKLKEDEIREIKKLINEGYNNKEIAKVYNVTHSNISSIKLNKTWKHL